MMAVQVQETSSTSWKHVPIGTVYLGLFDGPHATPPPSEGGPIFLGIGNLTDDGHLDLSDVRHISEDDFGQWTRRVLPQPGDIVFTYEATLNRYAIIPEGFRGCLGRRLALIRPNPAVVDTHFLFYSFFGSEWRSTIAQNTLIGSTVDRIPLTQFPEFPILLPPLPIQRKIAAILSAYDDLIENNTRRIALLEAMAQALYREWFVRFRFPGHEAVPLVDSPLGPIPEGWRATKLGDVAQAFRGRSYASSNLVDNGGLPFLNLKCIDRGGGFRYDGVKRYLGPYKESQVARRGDIIVAVTDMTQERRIVARAARVPPLDDDLSVFSMDLVRLVPNPGIPSEFLYGMLRYSSFPDEVKQHANGANVLHLNPDRITDYEFSLPSGLLQRRYSEACSDYWTQAEALEQRNSVLRQTRDLLLPRLVSGTVDVAGMEVAMGEDVGGIPVSEPPVL